MTRARRAILAGIVCLWAAGARGLAQPAPAPAADAVARVDAVFTPFVGPDTPGCAVSAAQKGDVVFSRGYGMASLEHAVPISADTVFEAGSVSKQFTAAAIGLLVQDGKLSLDDDVRKYIPEVPDFGTPIHLSHFLNHTSGLRSQWPLLTLAGRPPGEVVHTTREILDLVHRQRRLNFSPGEEFLYNNTGYTLLGVVVQRVTGTSLAEFTAERLFGPLGMTSTSWRDDHTRVVKGRATAYARGRDGTFHTAMPFTNVYGNGGLLTTVGDLQKWNANFDHMRVGGPALAEFLQTRGRLNDGYEIPYARGLQVLDHRGIREVSHGGATAGYRAFLVRFPDDGLSIALLCNTATASVSDLAHAVAEVFFERPLQALEPAASVPASHLAAKAGLYRNRLTDAVLRVTWSKQRLTLGQADPLVPLGGGRFRVGDDSAFLLFEPDGPAEPRQVVVEGTGSRPATYERVVPAEPTVSQLAEYAGTYHSDELETTYTIIVKDAALWLRQGWAEPMLLRPAYADAFEQALGRVVRFTRDGTGTVDGLSVYAGRVRHLRFERR